MSQAVHDTQQIIALIRELQASRQITMRSQLRIKNQARSRVRRFLGWQFNMPEKERERINRQAAKLVKAIEAEQDLDDDKEPPIPPHIIVFVQQFQMSRNWIDDHRASLEKQMRMAATDLPAYEWWTSIRGCNALGLAIIVGEAGDLSNYPNPGKLWKRFGLAPPEEYRTVTQSGTEALLIPRRRRSCIWTLGECLIKQNQSDGKYKMIYDQRKQYELDREDEGAAGTLMHAHMRAKRYMEKRLLKELWMEWNGIEEGHVASEPHADAAVAV